MRSLFPYDVTDSWEMPQRVESALRWKKYEECGFINCII